jgi:hypothetical protein
VSPTTTTTTRTTTTTTTTRTTTKQNLDPRCTYVHAGKNNTSRSTWQVTAVQRYVTLQRGVSYVTLPSSKTAVRTGHDS